MVVKLSEGVGTEVDDGAVMVLRVVSNVPVKGTLSPVKFGVGKVAVDGASGTCGSIELDVVPEDPEIRLCSKAFISSMRCSIS